MFQCLGRDKLIPNGMFYPSYLRGKPYLAHGSLPLAPGENYEFIYIYLILKTGINKKKPGNVTFATLIPNGMFYPSYLRGKPYLAQGSLPLAPGENYEFIYIYLILKNRN
jgi:hypothetical protein